MQLLKEDIEIYTNHPKSDHMTADSYLRVFEGNSEMTPGFTMSMRTRPLVVSKFREYIGDRSVTIQSKDC
jgi:hypothetical protein